MSHLNSIVQNLHQRITSLEVSINAPVGKDRKYTAQEEAGFEGTPQDMENDFQTKYKQEVDIPIDYLQQFETMLHDMMTWAKESKGKERNSYRVFTCPIVYMDMIVEPAKNTLRRDVVLMRPCAEKNGFYKIIMWVMRHCVIKYGFDRLLMKNVLDTNKSILKSFGFRVEVDEIYEYDNCVMTREELEQCTMFSWRLGSVLVEGKTPDDAEFFDYTVFPTSSQLNDQYYVNKKFQRVIKQDDHETDRAMPHGA